MGDLGAGAKDLVLRYSLTKVCFFASFARIFVNQAHTALSMCYMPQVCPRPKEMKPDNAGFETYHRLQIWRMDKMKKTGHRTKGNRTRGERRCARGA